MTTRYARGTDRYRAPELVTLFSREKPKFTNKVDIWAFGCIIFELVCSKPAFPGGDSQVWVYAKYPTDHPLDLQIAAENVPDDKKREWFSTSIQELLQLEPARRPSAKDICLRIIQFAVKNLATKQYKTSLRPVDYIVVNALKTHMATSSQFGAHKFLQELRELDTGRVLWKLEMDRRPAYPCFSSDGGFAGFHSTLSIVVIDLRPAQHLRLSLINIPSHLYDFQSFALSPAAARVCFVISEPHGPSFLTKLSDAPEIDILRTTTLFLEVSVSVCYSTDGAHLFYLNKTYFECYEVRSGTSVNHLPLNMCYWLWPETIQLYNEDWLVTDFITGPHPSRAVIAISKAGAQRTMLQLNVDYRGDVIVSRGKVMAFSKDGEIVTSDGERSTFKPIKSRRQDGRVLAFTAADEVVFLTSTGEVHHLPCEPFVKEICDEDQLEES